MTSTSPMPAAVAPTRAEARRQRRRSRRRIALPIIGLLLAGVVVSAIGVLRGDGPERLVARSGSLELDLPTSVAAGEPFQVRVTGAGPGVQLARLAIDAGYGQRLVDVELDADGSGTVDVPAAAHAESGAVSIIASASDQVVHEQIEVTPLAAVDPIDLYLGPRTVIADGVDYAMIVAVPEDRLGNPVAAGTSVEYVVSRPSLAVEQINEVTEGLLSSAIVTARTVTGRTRVGVTVDDAGGPERTFLEVAGVPQQHSLELIDPVMPADGAALLRLQTTTLVDVFDNPLPDGTSVTLDVQGVTGPRRIHGLTIDAIAEFVVEVPAEPGQITTVATASGVQGVPLVIELPSAVESVSFEAEWVVATRAVSSSDTIRAGGILVTIGPVRSVRRSHVPDGTVATASTVDTSGEPLSATVELEDGVGSVLFDEEFIGDPRSLDVEVEVLGTVSDVTVEP